MHADDDETALPDDIAVCEEEDDDDEDAAAADGDGDVDMFGGEDGDAEQRQARQKQWGGRKVPKNISAAIAAAMESDGGFAVTKFNMNAEREEGNIDEEVSSGCAKVHAEMHGEAYKGRATHLGSFLRHTVWGCGMSV